MTQRTPSLYISSYLLDKPLKAYVDTDPCLGLTPIAEQHPTTKTFRTFRYVLQVFTLAFATGSFPVAILDWH
jgi:hypothetical protein